MAPRRKKAGTNSDKSGKPKKDRVKKSGAAAAKKPHPSKGKKFPGKRKAHFAKATAARKALGKSGPGPAGEFVERAPGGTFVNINGLPEKGCEGKECRCGDVHVSSCKAHPSREKVRTGQFTTCKCGDKTRRRAEWVLKALVEAGHVEVGELPADWGRHG